MRNLLIKCVICLVIATIPANASAKYLFRAAPNPFTSKFMKGGLEKYKMNPNARMGREIYFADSIKTAVKEKPFAKSFILYKKSKTFNNSILDTSKMSLNRLKRISSFKDMRGTIKRGVIGPKLGHTIGNYAKRNNLIIKYKSARYKRGFNFAFSRKLLSNHHRIVRPIRSFNVN